MMKPLTIAVPITAHGELAAAPIAQDWIKSGAPHARYRQFAKSIDGTSWFAVWDCTSGAFDWHYDTDETFVVVAGEALITAADGRQYRLVEGGTAYCPAGSSCHWHVPRYVKKVAFLRKSLPAPVSFGVRAWFKLLQIAAGGRTPGFSALGEASANEAESRTASGAI